MTVKYRLLSNKQVAGESDDKFLTFIANPKRAVATSTKNPEKLPIPMESWCIRNLFQDPEAKIRLLDDKKQDQQKFVKKITENLEFRS